LSNHVNPAAATSSDKVNFSINPAVTLQANAGAADVLVRSERSELLVRAYISLAAEPILHDAAVYALMAGRNQWLHDTMQ
jgi:hypothetical protein